MWLHWVEYVPKKFSECEWTGRFIRPAEMEWMVLWDTTECLERRWDEPFSSA